MNTTFIAKFLICIVFIFKERNYLALSRKETEWKLLFIFGNVQQEINFRNEERGYIASEVRHDFVFDTQMSLGRETSAEKSGLVMNGVVWTWLYTQSRIGMFVGIVRTWLSNHRYPSPVV